MRRSTIKWWVFHCHACLQLLLGGKHEAIYPTKRLPGSLIVGYGLSSLICFFFAEISIYTWEEHGSRFRNMPKIAKLMPVDASLDTPII